MSFLDLIALQRIFHNGVEIIRRKGLNFVGGTVEDDDVNDLTIITLADGGGGEGTLTGPLSSTTGNVATWLGTDGTELDDSGIAIVNLATSAAVASAISSAISTALEGRDLGTDGAKLDLIEAGAQVTSAARVLTALAAAAGNVDVNAKQVVNAADPTTAQALATKAYVDAHAGGGGGGLGLVAAYQGHTTASVSQTSTTWADFLGAVAGGAWTDDIQDGITRSGSSFTVSAGGRYLFSADLRTAQVSGAAYGNWRVRRAGATLLEHSAYSGDMPATAASPAGQFLGVLALNAGDVLTLQYVGNGNSAISAGTSDGEARWTGKVSIVALAAAANGASGWQTALDVNFTQLANQTIVDGANTIAGRVWTAENIASGADSVAIGSSGLVLTNNALNTARFYQSASSAPLIKIKLSDLIPDFVLGQSELRCWLQGGSNGNSNHEVLIWGIHVDPWLGGSGNQPTWHWQLGSYDSISPCNGIMATRGTTSRGDVNLTSVTPGNSPGTTVTSIDFKDCGIVNFGYKTTAAADTDPSNLVATFAAMKVGALLRAPTAAPTSAAQFGYTGLISVDVANYGTYWRALTAADLVLCIASGSNNTAHHLVSTIKRLHVEYKL